MIQLPLMDTDDGMMIVGAWRSVPIAALKDPARTAADLSIPNPAYVAALAADKPTEGMKPELLLWRRDGDRMLVPRHCAPTLRRPLPERPAFVPNVGAAPFRALTEPRDAIQQEALEWLARPLDGRLMLNTGAGKTEVALMAAAKVAISPMLVVVHEQATLEQWRRRIADRTSLSLDDVGVIQGGVHDFHGRTVAVAMMHTLALRDTSWDALRAWIRGGVVVYDELDVYPAERMMRCLHLFDAVRWGLTATHRGEPALQRALELHIGPREFYRRDFKTDPKVISLQVGVEGYACRYSNVGSLLTNIEGSNRRWRDAMIDLCVRSTAKGRRTMLLMQRTEPIEDMALALRKTGLDARAVHGGITGPERLRRLSEAQVVVANRKIAGRAIDVPDMATVIFEPTSNKALAEQIVGRILRTAPGKARPVAVVVWPWNEGGGVALSMMRNMSVSTLAALRRVGLDDVSHRRV